MLNKILWVVSRVDLFLRLVLSKACVEQQASPPHQDSTLESSPICFNQAVGGEIGIDFSVCALSVSLGDQTVVT